MIALVCAKEAAQKVVMFKWMAADMVALSSTEVDLTDIAEGQVYYISLS
jgi:hypothetical protein